MNERIVTIDNLIFIKRSKAQPGLTIRENVKIPTKT